MSHSPAGKSLAAVRAGSPRALDVDVPVQACLADQAAATVDVTHPVLAGGSP